MVKQEVLTALDAARGRYISGQELAAQLAVSRTAVWKAVAALRRDGIPIKAVTNRGYTLAQSVDVLNAAAVAVQLDEATVKALQIEVVDRLPGTNAALRSRADAGAREGLVLIAQAQSAGRGRGGHSFCSPPGGLYMSILLRPEIGARQAVGLTAMAAVAAARAAERLCGVPITIKWVNDLWKNGKKVCGILTEAALDLESGMLDYAVLGLGFNVAAPADGWPEDLRDVAGTLYDGSPAPGARAALAAAFLLSKPMAAYQMGESYARSVGVPVRAFSTALVLLSSLLSACVTAFAGPISFVGIAVPHLVKNLLGSAKPLYVLPGCCLGGAAFCLLCDLIARSLFAPTELSISSVTAVFGAPVVIWLLVRRQTQEGRE